MFPWIIGFAAFWVFQPALQGGFLELDDPFFVTANPVVQQGLTRRGIALAFLSWRGDLWHPLTWLSHMLDCQLYGLDPWGHLLTSLDLHAINAGLLCWAFHEMTANAWVSALAACLWALHPLRVESVAWIAERKDVLSGFLFLCSLVAYLRWHKRRTPARYLFLLMAFLAALMSKPSVVMLPVCLLLLDLWPLGRLAQGLPRTALIEKTPSWKRGASNPRTRINPAHPSALLNLRRFSPARRL